MKRFFIFALVASVFVACSTDATQDLAPEIPTSPDELYVSFDEDSRVQLGENGAPVWTEGDLVSVFYRSNANDKYQFQGKTGDTEGSIKLVESGTPTVATPRIVAVYPYSASYWFNWETYNVEAFLPAEQTYLAYSYGVGSSLMVSQGEYKQFSFKNVCGWLKLQFTGTGSVSKIVLRGNNGEQVAGEIYINTADASCVLASAMGESGDGTGGNIIADDTVLTEVTLNCGDAGVRLNAETPKAFYIALPPQTFTQGITIDVLWTDGSTMTKSTTNSLTIERNHIVPMAEISVLPNNNEIWYTSYDGNIVEPLATDVFGATIVSNTYENGKGIIKFNGNITSIGEWAFRNCKALTSVTIPNSVTSIGNYAFSSCSALKSITIPNSVTSIGNQAFSSCSALTSITIPDSVTSIGEWVFYYCKALKTVTIGNGVTEIGEDAFLSCSALESVTIGNSVTSIESGAFSGCYALTRVDISDLEAWCKISFDYSYSNPLYNAGNLYLNGELLENVVIPESITELKGYVFCGAKCIKSVTIHNKVTSIGSSAFENCSALIRTDITDLEAWCKISFTSTHANPLYNDGNLYLNGELVENLVIPNNITLINFAAFCHCISLKSIIFHDGITSIRNSAFRGCDGLTNVVIGNGIASIGDYAFEDCKALKEVYCKPTTPPTADNVIYSSWVAFDNNAYDRKICVPTASVDAYKAASGWSKYADSIVPYNFTE